MHDSKNFYFYLSVICHGKSLPIQMFYWGLLIQELVFLLVI